MGETELLWYEIHLLTSRNFSRGDLGTQCLIHTATGLHCRSVTMSNKQGHPQSHQHGAGPVSPVFPPVSVKGVPGSSKPVTKLGHRMQTSLYMSAIQKLWLCNMLAALSPIWNKTLMQTLPWSYILLLPFLFLFMEKPFARADCTVSWA